jgi:hypothetical protein
MKSKKYPKNLEPKKITLGKPQNFNVTSTQFEIEYSNGFECEIPTGVKLNINLDFYGVENPDLHQLHLYVIEKFTNLKFNDDK